MKFWNFYNKGDEGIELRIEGDIVDDNDVWMYEWFGESASAPNKFRNELDEYKNKDLTVWIDSYGGSVFAGASIYNALKAHGGKVTVKIDSKAMSAASVIAMAGDEIIMSPVALMMIHNPLTGIFGDMQDLRKTADILDEVKESIMNAYEAKTDLSRDEISEMMNIETYMSAKTALKHGFIDGIEDGETLDVANMQEFSFDRLSVVNNTQESVKKAVEIMNQKDQETEKEKLLMELDLF